MDNDLQMYTGGGRISSFRRRLMMMQKKEEKPLPEGYTRYNWIKSDSTATAYISIPVVTKEEMSLKIDMNFAKQKEDSWFLYSRLGAWNSAFGIIGNGIFVDKITAHYYASSGASGLSNLPSGRQEFTFQAKNGLQILTSAINGTVISTDSKSSVVTSFVHHNLQLAKSYISPIYESWIYDDFEMTTELWHAVACTNELGEAGVYDFVSQQFYKSAVSGNDMIVGND